jgi:hypothetical protein
MSLSAPVITNAVVESNQVTVYFTPSVASGTSVLTGHEYSTNNGASWQVVQVGQLVGPMIIDTVVNGGFYIVKLRGIDENQDPKETSPFSNGIRVIPYPVLCCVNIEAIGETYLKYAEAFGLTQSAPVPAIPVVV